MFDEKPEISETLEWMLQSRQVGDETLVNTLVHEQHTALYKLGLALFNTSDSRRGDNLAEQVICAAVEDAQEYRQEVSVQVWLFRKVVKIYQRSMRKDRVRTIWNQNDGVEGSSPVKSQDFWISFDALTEDTRLIFILRYFQELSIDEIALILVLPDSEVEERLNLVVEKWSSPLGEDQEAVNSSTDIKSFIFERWPAKTLTTKEEKRIVHKILNILQEKERRKHRFVILGELVLVVLTIVIVAGMGRMITELTPEPTLQKVYQTELVNQIVFISPTPGPTQPPTPFPDLSILYRAEGGETLADIADRIFLSATILEALNHIPADQPLEAGQRVMIGVSDSQILMPTQVGSIPLQLTPLPTKVPLTLLSSEEDIRQRILESRENRSSLWADALVIQYGPPGYVGKPDLRRQQIWIDQPYFSYLLDGVNDGKVEYIYTSLGGLVNLINIQTGEQVTTSEPEQSLYFPDLQQMLIPSELREDFNGEIEILRRETIAEREVLVLDWFTEPNTLQGGGGKRNETRIHQGRYWVDVSLGLILRQQKFNGNDLTQLFEETIVTKIEFNPAIPRRLFDRAQPLQTYFAQDYLGDPDLQAASVPAHVWSPQPGRELIPYEPPPTDFAAEESRLTFQWTSLETFNVELGTYVDLFAHGYYLGNIGFAEPNQLFCTRSSDGNLLAFSGWSEEVPYGYTPLGWFSLTDLPNVHQFLPEIVPYDFAFSPDNRQLAVYGCSREDEQECGIYLVDTLSGETRLLTAVERGSGLLWSSDSTELAIGGSFLRQGKWRVLVFSVETGNTVYDGPFDWEGFWVAPDSPIHDWGVPYPPIRGGLEVCSQPPQGG